VHGLPTSERVLTVKKDKNHNRVLCGRVPFKVNKEESQRERGTITSAKRIREAWLVGRRLAIT